MKIVRLCSFAFLLAACGASKRPAEAPASEAAPDYQAAPMGAPAPAAAAPAAPPPAAGAATMPAAESTAPGAARVDARSDLARAEREVDASRGDCDKACRALTSMDRAAQHLCALGDADECHDARARVKAARDRVIASCGSCTR